MAEVTTRLAAREAIAADLRQFFKSTIQNVTGVEITVDASRDFAQDKFRIRGWYALLGDAYSSLVTLNGAIGAGDVQIFYTSTGDPVQTGDVILIGNELLLVLAVNTALNRLDVIRGYNGTIAAAHLTGVAITRATGAWRPIVNHDPTTGVITVNRAFSPVPANGDPLVLLGILDPPAWDDCLNEALTQTPRRDRFTTPLLANTWEYALPSWVQIEEQVEAVKLRYAPAGSRPQEISAMHLKQEDENAVSIQLRTLPADVVDVSLLVDARRYYTALQADTATTTMPLRHLRAVGAEVAANRILHELGASGKEVFGVSMAIIRDKANNARKALLGQSAELDYSLGHTGAIGPVALTSGPDWS